MNNTLVAPQCLGLEGWPGFVFLNQTVVTCMVVLTVVMGVCSSVANALVLAAIYRTVYLQTTANLFLTSLALSDLSMGCVIVPLFAFGAVSWPYHSRYPIFGMVVDFMLMQSLIASTFNLCVISWDRHVAVKSPLRYTLIMTKRKCLILIALIWTASLAFSVQSFTNASYEQRPKLYFIPSLAVPIPSVVFIGYCYLQIYKEAMKQKRRIEAQSPSVMVDAETAGAQNSTRYGGVRMSERFKKERKASMTVAIVIGTFLACWLPNMLVAIVQFIYTSSNPCYAVIVGEFWLLSLPVSSINAFADPLIYVLRNNEFKQAIRALLCSKWTTRRIGWTG